MLPVGSIRVGTALGVGAAASAVHCKTDCVPQGGPLMSKQPKSEPAKPKAEPAKPKSGSAKVDLNAATADELHAVKGIGKSRALEIVRYRDKHGPFMSLDELGRVPHMGDTPWGELDRVKQELKVCLAGDAAPPTVPEAPKVDVNSANVEELRTVEGIGPDRAQEIVDWREKYGRFRDLSELDTLPHFK